MTDPLNRWILQPLPESVKQNARLEVCRRYDSVAARELLLMLGLVEEKTCVR